MKLSPALCVCWPWVACKSEHRREAHVECRGKCKQGTRAQLDMPRWYNSHGPSATGSTSPADHTTASTGSNSVLLCFHLHLYVQACCTQADAGCAAASKSTAEVSFELHSESYVYKLCIRSGSLVCVALVLESRTGVLLVGHKTSLSREPGPLVLGPGTLWAAACAAGSLLCSHVCLWQW